MSDKTNEKVPSVVEENTEQNEVAQAQQSQELQEPKNVQELTNYIQSMLQQMQDRFQTMSDQVNFFREIEDEFMVFIKMSSLLQIISRIDEMAGRIDDLEHNINDLMVQAGQGEGTPALTSEHQHQK